MPYKDPAVRKRKSREAAKRWKARDPEGFKAAAKSASKRWRDRKLGRGEPFTKLTEAQTREIQRRSNLKRHYGISIEEYESIAISQDGRCAICRCPPKRVKRRAVAYRLCVDHDHATGRVRGLLCNDCNRALGLLGDDPHVLLRAVGYLWRHRR